MTRLSLLAAISISLLFSSTAFAQNKEKPKEKRPKPPTTQEAPKTEGRVKLDKEGEKADKAEKAEKA